MLHAPVVLACLGATLLLFALFAPQRRAHVTLATRVFESPLPDRHGGEPMDAGDYQPEGTGPDPSPPPPTWPERIDERATGADATTRLRLVAALADVGEGWADDVLRVAFSEDPDPNVRAAISAALYAD